jgi:hypothetical protein
MYIALIVHASKHSPGKLPHYKEDVIYLDRPHCYYRSVDGPRHHSELSSGRSISRAARFPERLEI